MSERIKDRIAIVTGGAEGIGRVFARRLADEGAIVVIADLQDGSSAVAEITAAGGRAHSVVVDVTDPQSVNTAVAWVADELGAPGILVNNAGIYPAGTIFATDEALWRRVFAVNVDGAFFFSKAVAPLMRDRGWGRIVNMTTASVFAPGRHEMLAYIAAKAAVVGFTRALASDLGGFGITVNAISPGAVITEQVRRAHAAAPERATRYESYLAAQAIPRAEVPEDMAGTLAFLVSDDAAFVTGQTLSVDGGHVKL